MTFGSKFLRYPFRAIDGLPAISFGSAASVDRQRRIQLSDYEGLTMSEIQLNYERIYQQRFKGVSKEAKEAVWKEISLWIYKKMGSPKRILDPAAGNMEFLKGIPAQEKWGVDLQEADPSQLSAMAKDGIRFIHGNIFNVDLPLDYFEGVFISNFLEHLNRPEEIQALLTKLHRSLKEEGRIAIMGPNFKFCSTDYFDCADHRLALTHISVEEYLYASEFRIEETFPRFLPYSFRSRFPASPSLVKFYLSVPMAWRFLGKQFLILARK
jgi:ubiquinone/menaquinone biosynthesis C-methylase UbiE